MHGSYQPCVLGFYQLVVVVDLLLSLLCVFYVLLQVLLQLAVFFLEVALGTEVAILHLCLELLYSVEVGALG